MKLLFPETTDFSQLFVTATLWAYEPGRGPAPVRLGKIDRRPLTVTGYCYFSGHPHRRSLCVRATAEVLQALRDCCVFPGSINFQVLMREAGRWLVTAEYNEILGGVWLAEVEPDSCPVPGVLVRRCDFPSVFPERGA